MTDNKRSRDRAEQAFSKTQTQHLERARITSEQDAADQARNAKTARLRALRLEKERGDAAADAALATTRPAGRTKRAQSR